MNMVVAAFVVACLFMAFLSLIGITPSAVFVGIATPLRHRVELAIMWILGAVIILLMGIFIY